MHLVVQILINILPDDDAERRLLEGFLIGWEVLPEVVRQAVLTIKPYTGYEKNSGQCKLGTGQCWIRTGSGK